MVPEVICAGPALVDCIFKGFIPGAPTADSISVSPGGEALNEAVALSRLGRRSALLCAVGDDLLGNMLVDFAAKSGVNVEYMVKSKHIKTPVSGLFVDNLGERSSVTSPALKAGGFLPDIGNIQGVKAVTIADLFRYPFADPDFTAGFAAMVKAAGALLFCDTKLPKGYPVKLEDFAAVFPYIDYLLPNDTEAEYYTGESDPVKAANIFRGLGAKCVIVTCGRRGAFCLSDSGLFHIPAYDVPVSDGIGAGDAFAAGLISGLLESKNLNDACSLAAAAAAICIGAEGASSGITGRSAVERFLADPPPKLSI